MDQNSTQDRPPVQLSPQGYGPAQSGRGGVPAWVWILIGLMALVVVACVGVALILWLTGFFSTPVLQSDEEPGPVASMEPLSVVTGFYGGLHLHDYEGAHSHLGDDLAGRYTADDLARLWQPLEEGGDEESTGVVLDFPLVKDLDGNRATVQQTLNSAAGNAYTIVLQLEKSEDGWKIIEAQPSLVPEI